MEALNLHLKRLKFSRRDLMNLESCRKLMNLDYNLWKPLLLHRLDYNKDPLQYIKFKQEKFRPTMQRFLQSRDIFFIIYYVIYPLLLFIVNRKIIKF